MVTNNRAIEIISGLLVAAGVLLLSYQLMTGSQINVALPLVFLMLGMVFFYLVPVFARRWQWAGWLYLPGAFLLALGVIFLINVLTGDWNAWAYAWMLLISGVGLGLWLAAWQMYWGQAFGLAGIGLFVTGLTLFVVFGAIAGGEFIQVMAPILLVLGGAALWWFKPKSLLPDFFGRRLPSKKPEMAAAERSFLSHAPAGQPVLAEPLSARELEVLRLIDQGLSNAEIAARLTVAQSTVKTHINNIYGKLEVENRVQAIRRARELGLLNS